jgi:hypothetical protein
MNPAAAVVSPYEAAGVDDYDMSLIRRDNDEQVANVDDKKLVASAIKSTQSRSRSNSLVQARGLCQGIQPVNCQW